MNEVMKEFAPKENPPIDKKQCFSLNGCRLSVITDRILRVEVQNSSVFCDEPTQAVTDRSFCKTECTFSRSGSKVVIKTVSTEFHFDLKKRRLIDIILNDGRTVRDVLLTIQTVFAVCVTVLFQKTALRFWTTAIRLF